MKGLFLSFALFALPSLAAAPAPPVLFAQGVNEIVPTREANEMRLVIVVLRPGELRPICRGVGAYEGRASCSTFDEVTNTCTFYTLPPADVADRWTFEALGHNLWHCRSGAFHRD